MESKQVYGRIHSIETFGTVDGPGVRFVIFMQGCPMRCIYCHNPDTWDMNGGTLMSTEELLTRYEQNRMYYRSGGITVTGGEPMLQMEFLTNLFEEAKKREIHTCLDTSGICYQEKNAVFMCWLERLVKVLDLVLLDMKHIDNEKHQKLTGHSNDRVLAFAKYLDRHQVDMWIRHVAVEGYTTDSRDLQALGYYIGALKSVKMIDVLPYHSMGQSKYGQLQMEYPLKDMPDLSKEEAEKAKEEILTGVRKRKKDENCLAYFVRRY